MKFIFSFFILSLSSVPVFSQSMRDLELPQKCFTSYYNRYNNATFCYNEKGDVYFGSKLVGKLNQRFRDNEYEFSPVGNTTVYLREIYIENGNMVVYKCMELHSYGECGDTPSKRIFTPD